MRKNSLPFFHRPNKAVHAVDSSTRSLGIPVALIAGMTQIIIPFSLVGIALAMLVGGVLILGHAVKTWMDEREL